jgi:hypothetical protein
MNDAAADYPNYATALAIRAFRKAENREASAAPLAAMIAQLRAQQFVEQNGWSSGDPVYGGWGMGGPIHRPPATGHVDLSMTRYVLEALAAAKVGPQDPAMLHALAYLERSQGPDGGFHFSTVNLETNKAGEAEGGFLSYGTTTADGVIALRAAGLPESDPRLARAVAWLKEQHKPDRVPGFKDDSPRQTWATGLRFYYAAAISHAVPTLKVTLPEQDKDGSFRNPNNIVKEDDPLIATPFAIAALLNASTS